MSQSGFTPILIYASGTTTNVPLAANLTSSASGAELALNYADGKLFYKDSGGAVQVLATKGAGTIGGSNTQVQYNNAGALAGSANLTFDGTTLTANALTVTNAVTLSGGTANGVAYLNGSKVVTTGSALTFDGVTLGVGVSGSAWDTLKAIDLGSGGAVYGTAGQSGIAANAYYGASGFVYKATNGASVYQLVADSHRWSTAASGAGGAGITFVEGMRLTSTGLGIGTSSPSYKLDVRGTNPSIGLGSSVTSNGVQLQWDNSNGVVRLNTTGAAWPIAFMQNGTTNMTLDSFGNLGLGVTPSASSLPTIESQYGLFVGQGQTNIVANAYYSGGYLYKSTAAASRYQQITGKHIWYNSASGTAGFPITFIPAMTLDASGRLAVGTTGTTISPVTVQATNVNGYGLGIINDATNNTGKLDFLSVSNGGFTRIVGDGRSTGYIAFQTNDTERARIDSSGNLGIGTSSPGTKLDVAGQAQIRDNFFAGTSNAVANISAYSNVAAGGAGSSQFLFGNTTSGTRGYLSYNHANDNLLIGTTGTTKATLDSSGNLGLGVTPSAVSLGPSLQIANGAVLQSLSGGYTELANNAIYNSGFKYISTGTATLYESGAGAHKWSTAASGTAGNPISFTQAMTLDASGNLLVAKTAVGDTTVGFQARTTGQIVSTLAGSTNATDTLDVYSTGASAYRFYVSMDGKVNATSTTISAISDIRFKENVRDLDAGLDKILLLKPRLYDWKEGKGANIKNARGFIAQEFEQVFPDLIDKWKDPAPEGEEPYKSVRQDLIPVLVKAIQEQQAIIEDMKTRLAAAGI
jgi:hypothetical protein